MISFAFRMAVRETRAAWRHFLYFFVCIAIGVGALVAVSVFASNLEQTIAREARGLLGGDLEVRLTRLLSDPGQAVLRSVTDRGADLLHLTELVAMAAGDRPSDAAPVSQIIELKAVETGYPLFGTLRVEPARPLSELLSPSGSVCSSSAGNAPAFLPLTPHDACFGALVQDSLLIRMGLSVGDRMKIGQASFTITGIIRKEPDRMATLFSLGPRVMISREGLAAADLIKPGSRIRERYLLRLPAGLNLSPLVHELRGRLADDMARVSSYRDAQPQLKNFLDQLARYLGLIGLTALLIGGIGVGATVQAFLRQKLATIAILKTLGADSGTVIRVYLTQTLLLGLLGSLAGAALGVSLQRVLPGLLAGLLGSTLLEQVQFTGTLTLASFPPIAKGLALGLLTTLLFTLWPLLGIREVRPALIFRRDVAPPVTPLPTAPGSWIRRLAVAVGSDRVRPFTGLGIATGLATLAIWQAGSWRIGLLYLAGLAVAVLALLGCAVLLVQGLQSLSRRATGPRSLTWRHAIGNLSRPGSQAALVMISIGIGVMVMLTVSLLERSLTAQIGESRPADAPTFFFIDIQPDQRESFVRLIEDRAGQTPVTTPLVRSRLYAIDGQRVSLSEETEPEERGPREDRRARWYYTREYVLTFLDLLPRDNRIVRGRWWAHGERPERPLVSIEEDAAKHLGVDLGSTIELDIQGTTIAAEVASIRHVEWGNFSTNFYMIFSPGSLDGAPFTYVATVTVPRPDEVPLQQAVVAAFPNVTAINIVDVMDSFVRILDRLSLAIRAIAIFCLLAGAIVMAAALATTRYRRLYESVIFKALGATRGVIARTFAAEYALLGFVGGIIGIALSCALSWGVMYFVFDLTWSFEPDLLGVGLLLTVALAVAVGFLGTFRLLGQRPLSVLRHE